MRDIRYAIRALIKAPGFSAVAIIALALGIGANTAIFSVVYAVVLQPFPYQNPGRLVLIHEDISKFDKPLYTVPAPDTVDFQNQSHSFEGVAAFQNRGYELSGRGEPQQVRGARVSSSLFSVLGVQPIRGRTFTEEEDKPGKRVAVVSYALWQRSFGGDPSALGQTVTLSRESYTVIGVMPKSFVFPTPGLQFAQTAELWVPMAYSDEELKDRGDDFDYAVIARLKPGVSQQHASDDIKAIAYGIEQLFPPAIRSEIQITGGVTPLSDVALGNVRILAWLLLGAVGLVLLIACANVANLLLTRAVDRQKEIAIRIALGAGRFRLLSQFITESLLLAVVGGGAGLFLAVWGIGALASMAPATLPRANHIGVNSSVLLFTATLSLLTGLVFGAAPAFAASSVHLNETLKEGGRSGGQGARHQRLRSAVVVLELAFATVLLVSAGLLIRSFIKVREIDPGFRPQGVLTMSVPLPAVAYSKSGQIHAFYDNLLRRVQSIRGADSVGFSTDLPLQGGWTHIYSAEGYAPRPDEKLNFSKNSVVMGDYFQTMGIPLLKGRWFNDSDRPDSNLVVIVSESIARKFWPDADPIGKRLKWGPPEDKNPWITVVGVVADVKPAALDEETLPHTYEPYSQFESDMAFLAEPQNIAIRSSAPPEDLIPQVREAVSGLDNQLAITKVQTMTEVIDSSIAGRRFNTFLLIVFAACALLLAAVGIYGVIAYSVTQRKHEIGVRMALGARRGDVATLVLRQGGLVAIIGIGAGLAGAIALTRFLSTLLYQIKPIDPITMTGVAVTLGAVALLASYIPAYRAARVDPAIALRFE
ncbi:MAG TPA: ABC transporter permease [Blastocatellia bacterium]|nr:ABC transporter permease [Blastocatellia bacterium]